MDVNRQIFIELPRITLPDARSNTVGSYHEEFYSLTNDARTFPSFSTKEIVFQNAVDRP